MARLQEDDRRRTQLSPADHISDMFRTMERTRELGDKQVCAKEIADYAMRDNYDCITVLHALDHAYHAMNPLANGKDRRGGYLVLREIENYYSEIRTNFKQLFPSAKNWQEEKKAAGELVGRIKRNRDVVKKIPWFIEMFGGYPPAFVSDGFTGDVERDLAEIRSEPTNLPVVEAPANVLKNMLEDAAGFQREGKMYLQLLNSAVLPHGATRKQDLQLRNNVLSPLRTLETKKFKFLYNPYTHKFGPEGQQVSLADIDRFDLGKYRKKKLTDHRKIDRLGKMVLRYIASVPPGDLVWQRITDAVLMFPSVGDETGNFAEKMFLVQKWLGEKLYLSALTRDISDPQFTRKFKHVLVRDAEFDSLFAQALKNLDRISVNFFAVSSNQAAADATHAVNKLFGIPLNRAIDYCPIPLTSTLGSDRIVNLTREVRKLFSRSWPFVLSDLGERFVHQTDRRRLGMFQEVLINLVGDDYDKTIARDLIKHIDKNLGGIFRERLDSKAAQFARINKQIIKDMKSVDAWPHSQTLHNVTFSAEEVPEIMGIEAVNFLTGEDPSKPVSFHMILKEAQFGLSGTIEPNGDVVWKIDITSINPGMRHLLDYVVLASFHDLVVNREAVIKMRKKRGAVKVEDRRPAAPADMAESQPRPRSRIVYAYEGELEETYVSTSAHQLRHEVETYRKAGGFKPYHVGTKKMNLPGVEGYLRAYLEYMASLPTERAGKHMALVDARKALYQPNPLKVENLPPRFNLDPLMDPDAGEQLVDITREETGQPPKKLWRNTWKTEYDVPPLSDDEKKNLEVRYLTRYRGGSALAFSDVLKKWILDVEGDEE